MTQLHWQRPPRPFSRLSPPLVGRLAAALCSAVHGVLAGRRLLLMVAVPFLVLQLFTAPAAHAATYQYWGYWQLSGGSWSFAQKGPAQTDPADGSVEGWRWAVAGDTGRPPRVTPAFDSICGPTPVGVGKKRVAVVVDFGRPADGDGTTTPPEPTAACALVPAAATGAEVLAAVATVRMGDGGLVCGVDGYPASGCGGAVATLSDAQKAPDTPVTLAPTATPQALQPSEASGSTPGSTPGTAPTVAQTAGPVAAGATTAPASSGVPAVVWIGALILLLGLAALAWSVYRRRRAMSS